MNVIIAYLETMFSTYPATPRMAEARAELQAMMEDAYAAAIDGGLSENEAVGKVITEFGNLDELAPVLGISREVNPQPESATQDQTASGASAGSAAAAAPQPVAHPPITIAEAKEYASVREETEPRLGTAVALFVLAPALLVALTTLGRTSWPAANENVGIIVGVLALLALVATGVLILVGREQRLAPFARIERGKYTPSAEVDRWATALAATHARRRGLRLQAAVALWILAAAPVLTLSLLASDWVGVGVAATLTLVATGIALFVPSNWATSTAEAVTQGSENSVGETDEDEDGIFGVIASIYWPIVTAIYLAWSFIWNAWGTSWVIWPIAGVLFGALAAGFSAWGSYRATHRR